MKRLNKKKNVNVITRADQNVIGTKYVREIRLYRYVLNASLLRDGRTPLLYLSDVKMTFGMNRKATPKSARTLNKPPNVSENPTTKGLGIMSFKAPRSSFDSITSFVRG